jgi:hypothetical protein
VVIESLAETSQTQADALGRPSEIPILGDEDDSLVTEFEVGGEMNRVVSAQPEIFGVPASATFSFRRT